MAALAQLRKAQVPLVIEEFMAKCRLAEERRQLEGRAVVTIQAYSRGFLIRRRLQRLTHTAVVIQRWWRGYLGRRRGRLALDVHNRALRVAYFNAMATVIQRWWRGTYSRKHIHDYYARKRYLAAVNERNKAIRAELNIEAERAVVLQRQEAEERARRLFADKVAKLHHLVSTEAQPGIFNSPYGIATGTLPVIMGLPVEEHLKASTKAQLAASGSLAGRGSGSLGGSGRLPPLRSGSNGRSRSGSAGRSGAQGAGSLRQQGEGELREGSPGAGGGGGGGAHAHPYPYPAGSVEEVAGKLVPARYTLRQAADYEALHTAALIEEKVHRGEMLSQHPQAFTNALGPIKSPMLNVQTNRNLLPYDDPYDPTVGLRGPRFTPEQQKVSAMAFNRYINPKRMPVFDKNMAAEAY